MGRPPASTRIATPQRLLAAAEREFARHGLAAARLEDVARRAGIRRPSLLHHFRTKDALYAAVVRRAFDALGNALVASMESVAGLAEGFGRFLAGRPTLAPLILRELLEARGPGRRILLREVVPMLDRVEAFVRSAPPRRGVPVRAALMQIVSDVLLRSAAGSVRAAVWGAGDSPVLFL